MNILLVEDNPADVRLIQAMLKGAPRGHFELWPAGQLSDALRAWREHSFDVVLLDLGLPDSQGLDTLTQTLNHTQGQLPVIVLTGLSDETVAVEAVRCGAQDSLVKHSLTPELLTRTLHYALGRHQNQKRLLEKETRYRSLFENMLNGFAYCRMLYEHGKPHDFVYLEVNPAFGRLTGLKNVLGRKVSEVIPDIQRTNPELFEIYGRVALSRPPEEFETYLGALGIWFSIAVYSPAREHFVALFDNITERKRAEQAVRDSERLYRAIGETIDYGVWVCAPDGRNIYASESFLKLVGLTQEQCSNFGWGKVLHPDDAERTIAAWKECVRTGGDWDREHRFRGVDGKWHTVLARGVPVRDDQGRITCWAGINLDITQLKSAEHEIRHLNARLEQRVRERTAQLEAANQELEAFSYSVSHDLRAPLRHIGGFVILLQKALGPTLPDPGQHYLEQITDATRHMGRLIDDLLQFSRMSRSEMKHQRLDLARLVVEAFDQLHPEMQGRRIRWETTPLPTIQADPAMLRQALVNLLSNAIKYTRPRAVAEIMIGCAEENAQEVVIFVRDNGVGFDMQYADKLFSVFQRFHSDEEFEGTGLGLANVRRIIARHGGRTWAEAKLNAGATFYFSLPKLNA